MGIHHNFPLDADYVIKIRLQRDFRDRIRGLAEPHQLDVRLDGARVKLFTLGGEHKGKSSPVFSTATLGDSAQELYEHTADDALEVRFPAKAGPHLIQVAFLKETWAPEGALQYVDARPDALPRLSLYDYQEYKGGDPTVDSVAIGGPYEAKGLSQTPSRRRIFLCHPENANEEDLCAKRILTTIAHRAYRRPLSDKDVQNLLEFYREGRNTPAGFEGGIETALERVLVGPEFLFRAERDPAGIAPGAVYRISDLELASRLPAEHRRIGSLPEANRGQMALLKVFYSDLVPVIMPFTA